jgi:CMP-N,N'-diacetyllegionaminic acid synthase
MKILALIPARSGSKRVPNKNIRMLGNQPLILWTIDVVCGLENICDVLVSTDSAEIQSLVSTSGAISPWLRPSEIATDTATSVDVAIHALDRYEREFQKVDGLLLLQPTSPFRTKEYLERGIAEFISNPKDSVIGVTPVRENPAWWVSVGDGQIQKIGKENILEISKENKYRINGSFYLTSSANLRSRKSFYSEKTKSLICNSLIESIDIDSEAEFELAQKLCQKTTRR